MFRKNFREGGSSSAGKSSSSKMSKINRSGGKRSRDLSYSGPTADDSFTQYRTHIFFNANRGGYQDNNGG